MVLQSLRASKREGTSLSNFQLLLGMSKYDFKNNRFLEHYQCDFETKNIE